jgi:DNA-binding FrmR family transcriptional regulator
MGTLEEVKRMQQEGKSDREIISVLQQQRTSMDEIQEALAQSKIKQAVSNEFEYSQNYQEAPADIQMTRQVQQNPGMEPSLLGSENSEQPQEESHETQQNPAQQIYQDAYPEYSSYGSSSSFSADTISEIAEQAVVEKLSSIRNKMDSILDTKTILDSKISSLDERLKRLEKMIDRIQLSVLQRVGEYVSNVEDIKREMVETQKSFKSLLNQKNNAEEYTEN